MSTKGKVFKIISVLMAMVFISMLFTGCSYIDKEGKLWYNGNGYVETSLNDEEFLLILPDDDWKTIGYTWVFFKRKIISPSEELCVIVPKWLYIKDGCNVPHYSTINYDGVRVIPEKYPMGTLSVGFDLNEETILATKNFEVIAIDKIVDSSIVAPCNINSDYRFCVQLHCDQGFYWIFHAYVVEGKYYLHSANEDFGYLVVDEFADWLRTLEPTLN